MQFGLTSVIRIIASIGIGWFALLFGQYAYHLVKGLIANNPHEIMTVTLRGRELTGTSLYTYAAVVSIIPIALLTISILLWPKSPARIDP